MRPRLATETRPLLLVGVAAVLFGCVDVSPAGEGGVGGRANSGGAAGQAGGGGNGGPSSQGAAGRGGLGGIGGADTSPECSGPEDCDDDNDCTVDICSPVTRTCETKLFVGGTCAEGTRACLSGICRDNVLACSDAGLRSAGETGGSFTIRCGEDATVSVASPIAVRQDLTLVGEGEVIIEQSEFGALFVVDEPSVVELRGLTLLGGFVPFGAGAIDNHGQLTLVDVTLLPTNAAIRNDGTLVIDRSTITGDTEYAVLNEGTLVIDRTTLAGQGGDAVRNFGTATITNSTIMAENGTGFANSGTATLTNTTIVGGWTPEDDPAIDNAGDVTLIHVTVGRENFLRPPAQIANSGTMSVRGTIVDGSCTDPVSTNDGNIESPGDTCGFSLPNDLAGVAESEMALDLLANDGGMTPTIGLRLRGPAVDHIEAGACLDASDQPLTADQRGVPRPQGARCDAGAFELEL